jgi:type II restriction enzyme
LIKNLGFEEAQASYNSGSQRARAWSERWVGAEAYCPSCGQTNMKQFEANRPVADFVCRTCNEEYELKSQKKKLGAKIVDGAFGTMCERLLASNNPSLMLLNYDLQRLAVANLLVVPKHFFVRQTIEERKPLAPTARRAGWIGCNILLSEIPAAGRIYIVKDGQVRPKSGVLEQWQKTLFLRGEGAEAKGWLIEVMKCVDAIGRREFEIEDVYAFEGRLGGLYPNNRHVKEKIRQQLQVLRNRGYLDFVSRGYYRLRG